MEFGDRAAVAVRQQLGCDRHDEQVHRRKVEPAVSFVDGFAIRVVVEHDRVGADVEDLVRDRLEILRVVVLVTEEVDLRAVVQVGRATVIGLQGVQNRHLDASGDLILLLYTNICNLSIYSEKFFALF